MEDRKMSLEESMKLNKTEKSEVRINPFVDKAVIIAHNRSSRPNVWKIARAEKPGRTSCPFCPGNEYKTPEPVINSKLFRIPPDGDWEVRAFPNKFPALQIEAEGKSCGAHEVIVVTREHNKRFLDLTPEEMALAFQLYSMRYFDLREDQRLNSCYIFHNEGEKSGASQEHCHSQLIASNLIMPELRMEVEAAWKGKIKRSKCPFCEMLEIELSNRDSDYNRIIETRDDFVVLEFFASRLPFETWILPKDHFASFPHQFVDNFDGLINFCGVFKRALLRIESILGNFPFNFFLHNAPYRTEIEGAFHWHLEIVPRITIEAGFEYSTGVHINPVSPEEAARKLRQVQLV